MQRPSARTKKPLLGNPIQTTHGFILHQPIGNWKAFIPITDNIALTSSNDILATSADLDLLFRTKPDPLWHTAPLLIGVDFSCLSRETGYA